MRGIYSAVLVHPTRNYYATHAVFPQYNPEAVGMADDDEIDVELVVPEPVVLMDETCWVADPDALLPDSEAEGVLALMLRGGCLFYFDGETRQWVNVEDKGPKKAKLRTVQ